MYPIYYEFSMIPNLGTLISDVVVTDNEYQCSSIVSVGVFTSSAVMCKIHTDR